MTETPTAAAIPVHVREYLVRFADCDPAGIVFFPRYCEMLNTCIEDWFTFGLGIPYAGLIGERRTGVPTARLECDFRAPSRHGETLAQHISIEHLGRSSMVVHVDFRGDDGVLRVAFRQVLVCTSLETHRSQPWPDDARSALESAMAVGRAITAG